MNEKIKELYGQAWTYANKTHPGYSSAGKDFITTSNSIKELQVEKFAELIVRDIHAYVDGLDTAQVISNGILRRYGVEE